MVTKKTVLIISVEDISKCKDMSNTGIITANYTRVSADITHVILIDSAHVIMGEVMTTTKVNEWSADLMSTIQIKGSCTIYLNKFKNVCRDAVLADTNILKGAKIRYSYIDVNNLVIS